MGVQGIAIPVQPACDVICSQVIHGRLSRVQGVTEQWILLDLHDPLKPSHKPGYRNPVSFMGEALVSALWIPCPLLGLRGG